MSLVMSAPTPPSGNDELRERHCIHWFVNKGTRGAPGTAWQECEMCGMKLKDFLALSNQQAVQKARLEEAKWGKMQFSKLDKSHVGRSFYNRNTAFKNYAVKFWNNRIAMITDKFDKRIAALTAAQPRKDGDEDS